MKVLPSPWLLLALVLWTLASVGGGYAWGRHAEGNARDAQAYRADTRQADADAQRDGHIEAIGATTRRATNQARNDTQGAGDEAAARIRTVLVPGDCRTVPADIVRELDTARERINAKIGSGVRPGPAHASTAPAAY
ncbi:MAG TPA: hypothetical protein VFH59_07875 [Frateuria sp.]|uniref:hypothetical protein n=1 Tax=Frateuria sp. TaxID=2211372 RepID=UPI002D80E5E8|nr:hypothetical protein [Frateuria sp.]HET6805340.1 hypothetical protein [Frateuria sp.]